MKKEFKVNIGEEKSREMEKAWYEYNASRDIIAFLMQQDGVKFENLQEYINVAEIRFVECEKLKESLAKEFKPEEVDLTKYNYGFNFEEFAIEFTEAWYS